MKAYEQRIKPEVEKDILYVMLAVDFRTRKVIAYVRMGEIRHERSHDVAKWPAIHLMV